MLDFEQYKASYNSLSAWTLSPLYEKFKLPPLTRQSRAMVLRFMLQSIETMSVDLHAGTAAWPSKYELYGETILFPAGSFSGSGTWLGLFSILASCPCHLASWHAWIQASALLKESMRAWMQKVCCSDRLCVCFSSRLEAISMRDFLLYVMLATYGSPLFLVEKSIVRPEDELRRPAQSLLIYSLYGQNVSGDAAPCLSFALASCVQNGILCQWDPLRIMFSAGNTSEKLRMARYPSMRSLFGDQHVAVKEEFCETVVDLYAGIGYFSLQVLKHAKHVGRLVSIEKNPLSFFYLEHNVAALAPDRNAVHVQLRLGDHWSFERELVEMGGAHRILLGLLPSSRASWLLACQIADPERGALLHIHENVAEEKLEVTFDTQIKPYFQAAFPSSLGWDVRLIHMERVKSVAPRILHVVYDTLITKRHV